MGRGASREKHSAQRRCPKRTHAERRSPAAAKPEWSDRAAELYRASFSNAWVVSRLREEGFDVSEVAVPRELGQRGDLPRRRPPAITPFSHEGLAPVLTPAREARIEAECRARLAEGDSDNDVYDWRLDQMLRFAPVEHLCFNNDPLFNSRPMVEAMTRRLKKYHAAVTRPVGGEAFEDVLANAWRDVGHVVWMAPRNHEGPDIHVLQNQWVALSMKSEARDIPRADLHITSLAPHHQELRSPSDCVAAIGDALRHLSLYQRMIYLRVTGEPFPTLPQSGLRYTLLELPKADIVRRLGRLTEADFAANDFAVKNTFSVDVADSKGQRLFRVSISRQPPRVAIVSLAFGYSKLVTSYWLEEPMWIERLGAYDDAPR